MENKTTVKPVLHFSDGVLEVCEDEGVEHLTYNKEYSNPGSDHQNLDWGPWALQKSKDAGGIALKACDYLGEGLASFFGITTPKYQSEINEYYRLQKEEKERKEKDLELGSWNGNNSSIVVEEQVQSSFKEVIPRY